MAIRMTKVQSGLNRDEVMAPTRRHSWKLAVALCSLLALSAGCVERSAASSRKAPVIQAAVTNLFSPALAAETFGRAWELIYQTHFDTNFNGVDWLALRRELEPRARASQNMEELRRTIQEMLDRLGQSHFTLLPKQWIEARDTIAKAPPASGKRTQKPLPPGKSGPSPSADAFDLARDRTGHPGFEFRLAEKQMLVTRVLTNSGAFEAGVQPGWVVEKIGPIEVRSIIAESGEARSNRLAGVEIWSTLNMALHGPVGSLVPIEFRDGQDRSVRRELDRRRQPGEPVKLGNLPTIYSQLDSALINGPGRTRVGYIRFNSWMFPLARAFDEAVERLNTADGFIIDLRGNLGGAGGMIMGVSGHFLTNRISLGAMHTREGELNFFANPRRVTTRGERVEPQMGPLAILVDGLTYSASEVFTSGMQAIGRARVFGEQTTGGALPALFDKLPNGDVLLHAIADFVTPDGQRLEGRGVTPDVPIPLRREDYLRQRDVALQAAVDWIAQTRRR